MAAIGAAAEQAGHHSDVNLRYTHVDVQLTSRDEQDVTIRDVRLARTITAVAADAGLRPASGPVSRIRDTPNRASPYHVPRRDPPVWAAPSKDG